MCVVALFLKFPVEFGIAWKIIVEEALQQIFFILSVVYLRGHVLYNQFIMEESFLIVSHVFEEEVVSRTHSFFVGLKSDELAG